MGQRGLTQKVEQARGRIDHALHGRVFGVQNAQRVAVQATLGFFIEHVAVLLQVGNQGGAVGLALGGLAQAVEFQAHIFQAQNFPQVIGQQDQLCIDLGTAKAQHLGTNLVELAVAAALGALVAEHGAHVVQALAAFVQQVVLNHRAHQPGCAFGAQRELLAVQAVFKGVHLLFDDVGHLAQASHKQGCRLDDGQAHIAVGVTRHQSAHLTLQPLPTRRIGRQDVVHALDAHQLLGFDCLGRVFFRQFAHFFSADPEPKRFSM